MIMTAIASFELIPKIHKKTRFIFRHLGHIFVFYQEKRKVNERNQDGINILKFELYFHFFFIYVLQWCFSSSPIFLNSSLCHIKNIYGILIFTSHFNKGEGLEIRCMLNLWLRLYLLQSVSNQLDLIGAELHCVKELNDQLTYCNMQPLNYDTYPNEQKLSLRLKSSANLFPSLKL